MSRALVAILALIAAAAEAAETTTYPALGPERGALAIHAATDRAAMDPLIRDFQTLYPALRVDFVEYVTTELFDAAASACAAGRSFGDVLLSSSVDQLVKLANDGCAQPRRSPETAAAPRWANWRDEVFGFTYEPVAIVYNRSLVPPEDRPQSRLDLIDLLRLKPETYRGRVGTYDIRVSGVGYLFAFHDARQTASTYGRLLESLGRAQAVVRCCTGEILDAVESGRLLIGYNMLASYAWARVRAGADIGVVLPSDYTLALSRGAMIPATQANPAASGAFLDYLLSPHGRAVAAAEAFFFHPDGATQEGGKPIPPEGSARLIGIGPALLAVQDSAQRERFVAEWSRTMVDMWTP